MPTPQPHHLPPHPDVLAFGPNVAISVPLQAEAGVVVYRIEGPPAAARPGSDERTTAMVELYLGVEGSGGLYVTMALHQVDPLIEALRSARDGAPTAPGVCPASRWAPLGHRVR